MSQTRKIGYIRVSSIHQNTERQLDGFSLDKIFIDKVSGKNMEREQLKLMLEYLQAGDELFIHSLDRLGRNLLDLKNIVNFLIEKKVRIYFFKDKLYFDDVNKNSFSNFTLNIMGSVSEFEREIIRERQMDGIIIAKRKGIYKGKKKKLSKEIADQLRIKINQGIKRKQLAKEYGIGLTTLFRYKKGF